MNSSQKLGLFILIVISLAYVYFSFFVNGFDQNGYKHNPDSGSVYNPMETDITE